MNRANEEKTLRSRKRVFWVLHYSFLAASVMYFIISPMIMQAGGNSGSGANGLSPNLLFAIFLLLSLSMIVIGYVLPPRINQSNLPPNMASSGLAAESVLGKLAVCQVRMIVSDAFFQSIAIYGLVALLLGLRPWMGWGLMALSLALLAGQAGRYRGWLDKIGGPRREDGRGGCW